MAKEQEVKAPVQAINLGPVVDEWFRINFSGAIIAGNTPLHNLLHEAKEDLKKRLDAAQ